MDLGKFVAAGPAIAGALRIIFELCRPGPSWRHVERLTELQGKTEGLARQNLQELIEYEVLALVKKERTLIDREVDWGSVAAIAFILTVATAITWWMWRLGTWWSYTILTTLDVFAALLLIVGAAQIYRLPSDKTVD